MGAQGQFQAHDSRPKNLELVIMTWGYGAGRQPQANARPAARRAVHVGGSIGPRGKRRAVAYLGWEGNGALPQPARLICPPPQARAARQSRANQP